MKHALLWLGVAALCTLGALPGCEHLGNTRDSKADSASDEEEATSHSTKGFFKPTRLPGAMSSEGAEIERSLGVYQ
jgi:hypothetical protein